MNKFGLYSIALGISLGLGGCKDPTRADINEIIQGLGNYEYANSGLGTKKPFYSSTPGYQEMINNMETLKNKCDAIGGEVNGKVFSFKRSHTDHTVYSSGVCKTDLGDYKQDVTVDPSIGFPPSSILPHLVVSGESNPLIFKNSCKGYQGSLDSTTELLTCEINDRFFAVLPPHEHYPSPDWQCLDDYSIQKSKMLESCSNID